MGHAHSKREQHVCPSHSLAQDATSPVFDDLTFFQVNKIFSGSCFAFSTMVILLHMFLHATHLSAPSEQVKIMRISMLIPMFSLFSFLSISFPSVEVYLQPWLEVFQANSLAAFFLLMSEFILNHHQDRDVFLSGLDIPDKKAPGGKIHGVTWFRKLWLLLFQYPLVAVLVAVGTDITEATSVYCQFETKPYFAKLWLMIIVKGSSAMAILAVLSFYIHCLRRHFAQYRPMRKLIAFKLVISLGLIQSIIFWILRDAGALNSTDKLTYADLHMGIPNLLLCAEMVPISLLLVNAYHVSPYIVRRPNTRDASDQELNQVAAARSYQGGVLGFRAWVALLNPIDMLEATAFAIKLVVNGTQSCPMTVGGHEMH